MERFAVITGDLVASGELDEIERRRFITWINTLSAQFDAELKHLQAYSLTLFRGDSFQLVLKDPRPALALAIRMQAGLLGMNASRRHIHLSARTSIGIGTLTYESARLEEADGEAFHFSGRLLDEMKSLKTGSIRIRSNNADLNEEFYVHSLSLELIMSGWSPAQANAVLGALENFTQIEIAARLGDSQPGINQKLRAASYRVLEAIIARYENKFKNNS